MGYDSLTVFELRIKAALYSWVFNIIIIITLIWENWLTKCNCVQYVCLCHVLLSCVCIWCCCFCCWCYTMLLLCCVCGLLNLEDNSLVQVELPPSDLGATGLLNKSLQLLHEILSSHDSSSVTPEERKQAVAQVTTMPHCCAENLLNV